MDSLKITDCEKETSKTKNILYVVSKISEFSGNGGVLYGYGDFLWRNFFKGTKKLFTKKL